MSYGPVKRRIFLLAKHFRRFLRPRVLVPLALFFAFSATMLELKIIRIDQQQGDSAMYFQMIENMADRGTAMSNVFEAVFWYGRTSFLTPHRAQVATEPLTPAPVLERDVLKYHAYYILYPISLFAKFIRSDVLLLSIQVLVFAGLILLVYFLLRRAVPAVAAALFCLVVISHPAWSESLMWGQFYPDRIFVLAGFVFVYLAARRSTSRLAIVAAAIACALTLERGAMVAGGFLVLYLFLYWRETSDRRFKLALSAALLCYGFFILKFVLIDNAEYGGYLPTTIGAIQAQFQDPVMSGRTVLFLIANLTLLLVAFFEWRSGLIALIILLPNVFGNIGGAEKVGWSTHYHSFYLPILVWAAMRGYVVAYRLARQGRGRAFFYAGAGAALIFANMIDPFAMQQPRAEGVPCAVYRPPLQKAEPCPSSAPPILSVAQLSNNFFSRFIKLDQQFLTPGGRAFHDLGKGIADVVPGGATVSSVEAAMSFIYQDRVLSYFPEGIDQSDYAIITILGPSDSSEADLRDLANWSHDPATWTSREKKAKTRKTAGANLLALPERGPEIYADPEQKTRYGGVFFAVAPPDQLPKINAQIIRRMARDGYDFEHPKIFRALGIAVVKRRHRPHNR